MSLLEIGPFGRFQIDGVLGRGSMASVYRAYDPQRDEMVALKVLRQAFSRESTWVRRLIAEALQAASVQHPNVVGVYEISSHARRPFLVQELVRGETLRQRLGSGPLPERTVIDLLEQVCAGLVAIHECAIIHGDLKPTNIMLAEAGDTGLRLADEEPPLQAKIADFGIARLAIASRRRAEKAGNNRQRCSGTPRYMAPEMTLEGVTSLRGDIFALGVIAYEAVAGRELYPGLRDARQYAEARRAQPPPALKTLAPAVSTDFSKVVTKMLALKPEGRYDPEGLLRDLGRLSRRGPRGSRLSRVRDGTSAFSARAETDSSVRQRLASRSARLRRRRISGR